MMKAVVTAYITVLEMTIDCIKLYVSQNMGNSGSYPTEHHAIVRAWLRNYNNRILDRCCKIRNEINSLRKALDDKEN